MFPNNITSVLECGNATHRLPAAMRSCWQTTLYFWASGDFDNCAFLCRLCGIKGKAAKSQPGSLCLSPIYKDLVKRPMILSYSVFNNRLCAGEPVTVSFVTSMRAKMQSARLFVDAFILYIFLVLDGKWKRKTNKTLF